MLNVYAIRGLCVYECSRSILRTISFKINQFIIRTTIYVCKLRVFQPFNILVNQIKTKIDDICFNKCMIWYYFLKCIFYSTVFCCRYIWIDSFIYLKFKPNWSKVLIMYRCKFCDCGVFRITKLLFIIDFRT